MYEQSYKQLLQYIMASGHKHQARNATTTRVFNVQLTANLRPPHGFPLLTGRLMPWAGIKGELLAFLRGYTTLEQFHSMGCSFWDADAYRNKSTELGPIYGAQWRNHHGVDQLANLIESLTTNPASRRHLLTAMNPSEEHLMVLPPCHCMAQWHVEQRNSSTMEKSFLHCTVTMRSADMGLGVPADMASYALFTCLLAAALGFQPATITINMGDCHIYDSHREALDFYLQQPTYDLPTLTFNQNMQQDTLWLLTEGLQPEDIELNGYTSGGKLAMKLEA